MKLTIVPEDGVVTLDGESYANLDLSFIEPTIHAVQWYGTFGEVEYKDPVTGKMTLNQEIFDISPYQQAIDLWNSAKIEKENSSQSVKNPIGDAPNVIAC
jgi:hypothetical protein